MKTRKCLSLILTVALLLTSFAFGASAMIRPEGFDAFALLHIPQNLLIRLDEIDKSEGFVYGSAFWDDDEIVTECEFYPMLPFGNGLFRPKSNPFTIMKRIAGNMMAPKKVKNIDHIYDVENGVCSKEFVIKLLGDDEEIETYNYGGMNEANGVKIGSRLRFSMTALVEFEEYVGETPESDPVEIILTEDAVGKTFTKDGELDPFAADKTAFSDYKAEKAAALDALAREGDSAACQKLIADAKAEITALSFDESKSLDQNKAAADVKAAAVTAKLRSDLEAQRASEQSEGKDPAVCKWCDEVHEGFFGKIEEFFHSILYFFAHLFGLK